MLELKNYGFYEVKYLFVWTKEAINISNIDGCLQL